MDKYLGQLLSTLQNHLQDHPARCLLFDSMSWGSIQAGSDFDMGIEPLRVFPAGGFTKNWSTVLK